MAAAVAARPGLRPSGRSRRTAIDAGLGNWAAGVYAAPPAPYQERTSSCAPSSRASPSAPWRMTTSWFHANTGRATGASRFIHARAVRTFHS